MRTVAALLAWIICGVAVAADLPITVDSNGRVHINGPVTIHGTLNYFGTDSSDMVKLSSQSVGDGGVVLCADSTAQDYRPCSIRGKYVVIQYKIPDPTHPIPGWSGMSLPGLMVEENTGRVRIYRDLQLDQALDFSQSAYAYFRGNASHGYRFNDSGDLETLSTLGDGGRWRWHKYGSTADYTPGQRMLTVDSAGNIYTGPVVQ